MKKLELAWAAGFFEGEGCVGVFRGRVRNDGWRSLHLRLDVSQCESEPLEKLREMFGGSIAFHKSKNLRHSDQWHWCASGAQARIAIRLMYPFFVSQTKINRFLAVEAEIADNLKLEPLNRRAKKKKGQRHALKENTKLLSGSDDNGVG